MLCGGTCLSKRSIFFTSVNESFEASTLFETLSALRCFSAERRLSFLSLRIHSPRLGTAISATGAAASVFGRMLRPCELFEICFFWEEEERGTRKEKR